MTTTESPMSKPDLCIHHHPCADGFTAAWAIHLRWPDIEFHPGIYGEDPPEVEGKNVLIVDFSYKRPVLQWMAERAKHIVVLDHHKSAEIDLAPFARDVLTGKPTYIDEGLNGIGIYNLEALFDMEKSGARMAWEYAHPRSEIPQLVRRVEDRDLWRFALSGTREINANLFSRPYDFGEWGRVADLLETEDGWDRIFAAGEAIERKHHKDVAELLRICTREMVIGGHLVKVANIPYTLSSDAAGALAEGQPFGACYFDDRDGNRVFSLRSRAGGLDVSQIAAAYGGGGHAAAAGFRAAKGWEGDQ